MREATERKYFFKTSLAEGKDKKSSCFAWRGVLRKYALGCYVKLFSGLCLTTNILMAAINLEYICQYHILFHQNAI